MLAGLLLAASAAHAQQSRLLDGFEDMSAWRATASDSVSASLRQVDGEKGKGLCLDYDFNGVSGYAVARRTLPMRYPGNYEFRMFLRGEGPANNLEFKLADASGDNVWWRNQPNMLLPKTWTATKLKKRQIDFAWGPTEDRTLQASESFELTISAGKGGGKGSACIDELAFSELPTDDGAPLAGNLVQDATGWRYDLGRLREFGGAILSWASGQPVADYALELSEDGQHWRSVRTVHASNGGDDPIALPEQEARWLRVRPLGKTRARLQEIAVQPLAYAATPNDFVKAVAAVAPRGTFPRGFSGEQPYWTIVGVDGGLEQGLIGEDGAIELAKGAPSIEPFVVVDGRLVGWADVKTTQSLQDDYLPIPSVHWSHPGFALDITAFASQEDDAAHLHGGYRLSNTSTTPRDYVLVLAVRPFQVNPPSQFLNTVGGVSRIDALSVREGSVVEKGRLLLRTSQKPALSFATNFDSGEVVSRLATIDWSKACATCLDSGLGLAMFGTDTVEDATWLASGAMLFGVRLQPGESRSFDWRSLLYGSEQMPPVPPADVEVLRARVAAQWHAKLDRVKLQVPAAGKPLIDTLRTALANMLVSRTGPRLQPGTRSYARAWIRDGAMISEGLLRMGREDVAGDFLRWYAPYQFANGKVPCCVDDRGSDPVPENDSQGELIHAVAEQYRYTGDRALLEAMWPKVTGAVKYMDELRLSERTETNRNVNPAFFGLMPASISHEGYSAKPMHSYWDDFWVLRGYKDAVAIAQWLGREEAARRFAASRDEFRADLYASLDVATHAHAIDYLPGAAELGDFDPTSSTIALAPGGEQANLPQDLLHNTFERYWREFVQRRDGKREWKDYTPYELRTVGTFVRLGWRERAGEALDYFIADQQPRGWNQWAEVVSRTPRTPFFLGDLPHAWVASDYMRSVLDMFAYSRERDDALVIAAGIPAEWMQAGGVAVEGLRTPQGRLDYTLQKVDGVLRLAVPVGLRLPKGGLVLSLPEPWASGHVRGGARVIERAIEHGEVRINQLPAKIDIAAGPAAQ
ncbi:discoidin domain-containing protein [Thermomonas sp.]|uniref:discoidin domain-containing protein n=1 Tax=Thermomonas sp. TaxID=1971895 RepID=UPI002489B141|nr:discoidin domain-containing protein [Thermomonas sp.]MDI1253228.1 discoidin domain-containing protein [Thermomonas sp.]